MAKWRNCTRCPACRGRDRVVLARGSLPCDVCFIGEAPGESEDSAGLPFVGPAGRIMDVIVEQSLAGTDLTYALGNIVACIPRPESGGKAEEPSAESIAACRPRLEELLLLADPRLIVAVGRIAADHLEQGYKYSTTLPRTGRCGTLPDGVIKLPAVVAIDHPAYIIRSNIAQRGLMAQRCVIKIRTALEAVCPR